MTEEEQEVVADRFYAADAWISRQGTLAGWLWAQDQLTLANRVTVSALMSLDPWPDVMRKDLIGTFYAARHIAEKNTGWRSESIHPAAA